MAQKDKSTASILNSFVSAGKDLVQTRMQSQVQEYKIIGVEKGSKLAATVIVSIVQILCLALFWIFAMMSLGYLLSNHWDNHFYGFGVVALGHLGIVIFALILGRPVKWLISNVMMSKLS